MQTSSTYQGAMGSLDVGAGVVAGAVESDGVFGGAPVKITGVPDILHMRSVRLAANGPKSKISGKTRWARCCP